MSNQPNRYFVIEHATGIVRAAQPTFEGAQRYTTPENCSERFIVGPIDVETLHRLYLPKDTPRHFKETPHTCECVDCRRERD